MPNNKDDAATVDVSEMKARLLKLKAQLEHDIDVKEKQVAEDGDDLVPERGGVGNHMADEASDTSEQEVSLALQNSAEHDLDGVNAALARIADGTYGICANCGKRINPARLEARPSSIYCIDCQELADQGRI